MSVYKRGDVWWYKFRFAGQMIRESVQERQQDGHKKNRALSSTEIWRRVFQSHF